MCAVHRVFPMVFGNTMNSHKLFMDRLSSRVKLHEVYLVNECDIIIAFVPIVSRAGTDVGAALQRIPKYSYKSIILVSLHHTFSPDYIAPDSRFIVNRSDVFAVDCLYHEDMGLLQSQHNDEALERVIKHLGGEKSSYQGVDNTKWLPWIAVALSIIFLLYILQKILTPEEPDLKKPFLHHE